MAFRVKRGESVVECDTAAEASELADIFAARDAGGSKHKANGKGHSPLIAEPTGSGKYKDLLDELSGAPKAALETLVGSDGPITTDDLATKMGIEPQQIKYAMRTVQSSAGRFGISGDVIHSKRAVIGGKPKSTYWLPKQIKEALRAT
jgi:hypothetical protein